MSRLMRFAAFWYDFIVGDSAVLAVGAVAALAVTAGLVHAGMEALAPALLPVLVAITLAISLRWPR
jgi:hypothetical protein